MIKSHWVLLVSWWMQIPPGATIGPEIRTLGLRSTVQNILYFNKVKLGAERLIGKVEEGMLIAQGAILFARLGISTMNLGMMKRSVQLINHYTSHRLINTGEMINNPFTQVLLNYIVAEITCLSDLVSSIVNNPPDIQLREYTYSICKVLASEFMGQVADQFLQSLMWTRI